MVPALPACACQKVDLVADPCIFREMERPRASSSRCGGWRTLIACWTETTM
jgi:hypothetical protein